MKIRANAWHLKVFLQAYVNDRYWLDIGTVNPSEECQTPETVAFEEFEKEYRKLPYQERFSQENQKKLEELATASQKAFAEWYRDQQTIYTTNKSREVSERIYSGKMSLCPYFWRIVSALVFYYMLIRATRPFRNFFNKIAEGLATAVGVTIIAVIISVVGYGIYSIHDQIPTPADVVVSVKQSVKEYKQSKIQQQAAEAEQKIIEQQNTQARIAWEQKHPEEVARERAEREEFDRLRSQQNWQDFKEFAITIGYLVLGVIVVVSSLLAILGIVYLMGKVLEWLAHRFDWGKTIITEKPPSAFRLWLTKVLEQLRLFIKDTKELVIAFAKAKKERVCPFLEVVDGNNQGQH